MNDPPLFTGHAQKPVAFARMGYGVSLATFTVKSALCGTNPQRRQSPPTCRCCGQPTSDLQSTLDQLRTMAHHCSQTAEQVTAQGHLARLVELAQKWHEMANKAEAREAGKQA